MKRTPLVHAPSLEGYVDLLTHRPVGELTRGKFKLLHFMTSGCVNCIHLIAELARTKIPAEVVVVSVHTGKFDREKENAWVREKALQYGLDHPVVNDAEGKLWDAFAVRAWPTLVLVSPDGYEITRASGEGTVAKVLRACERFVMQEALAQKPKTRPREERRRGYAFGRIFVHDGRLYLSDLGGRLVVADEKGRVQKEYGGLAEPQGIVAWRGEIYVADRAAGKIFRLDPSASKLREFASGLRSPVGLAARQESLQAAVAGSHAVVWFDRWGRRMRQAGRGSEGLRDGTLEEAQFAQPTDLDWLGEELYVLDAEASALRKIVEEKVETVIGWDLFTFGDRDGVGEEVRLQHPEGLCAGVGGCGNHRIFVCDTYNDKLKVFDPLTGRVTTLVEGLHQPVGVCKRDCHLYIVELGKDAIVRFDLKEMDTERIKIA